MGRLCRSDLNPETKDIIKHEEAEITLLQIRCTGEAQPNFHGIFA